MYFAANNILLMRSCNHALVWKMAGRFSELSGSDLNMKIDLEIEWQNSYWTQLSHNIVKAETHDATNRCDTSPRQVAATNRLVWHVKIIVAATEFVAAICRTNSNWFEFVRHIAATKQGQETCRSNSADEATCRIVRLGLKGLCFPP